MHNTFLSIIGIIHQREDRQQLETYLRQLHPVLQDHFSDFEIILVNNIPELPVDDLLEPLPPELKHQVYLINLSSRTNKNHAILAGLDRANGDYSVIFESQFADQPQLILELFEQTRQGNDIVYLQAQQRRSTFFNRILHGIFYWILKTYSQLSIDTKAHNTRIISRRALNSLLRLRENLRYMKPIYSIVGYRTATLQTDIPLPDDESFGERFRTSLVAITSYTTFLRSLMLWLFLFSLAFLFVVATNAVRVKLTNTDLFGNYADASAGWTTLVVFIAIFFAVTCLNLYIISIYLSNIYSEIKQRPPYIVESIKRF